MAGFSLLIVFVVLGLAEMLQTKKAARHVLENLKEQNYEAAFRIHFYEVHLIYRQASPMKRQKEFGASGFGL